MSLASLCPMGPQPNFAAVKPPVGQAHRQLVGRRGRVLEQHRGVGAHLPLLGAKQAVDRLTVRLARDVPEGDVDPGDRMGAGAVAREVLREVIDALHAGVDGQRVGALQCAGHAARNAIRQRRLDGRPAPRLAPNPPRPSR